MYSVDPASFRAAAFGLSLNKQALCRKARNLTDAMENRKRTMM
jgi:hypothetical protein